MRIKITWEGNPDATARMLTPRGSGTKLWISVLNGLGHPARGACELTCQAQDTKLMHIFVALLERLGRRTRAAADVQVRRTHAKHAEFMLRELPSRRLPYWLVLHAKRSELEEEETRLFVVPSLNYMLSLVFVAVFAL